jgi:hypothetical protein
MRNGFDFEGRKDRDLALLGECDSGCKQLARLLGWEESLTELMDSALSALTGINLVESVENVAEAAEDVETADESGNDCSDDGQSAGEEAEFRYPVYAAESVATGNDVPAHSGVISSNSSDEDSI